MGKTAEKMKANLNGNNWQSNHAITIKMSHDDATRILSYLEDIISTNAANVRLLETASNGGITGLDFTMKEDGETTQRFMSMLVDVTAIDFYTGDTAEF